MAEVLRYPYEALTDSTDYLQINLIEKNVTNFGSENTLEKLSLINRGKFAPRAENKNVNINKKEANRGLSRQTLTSGGVILLPMASRLSSE